MAVSGTSNFNLAADTLCRRAAQYAGVLNAKDELSDDAKAMMRDFLQLELQAWQAEGLLQRHASRASLSLLASTASYTLPVDTLDVAVAGDRLVGMLASTQGRVFAMSRDEYQALANKTQSGPPSRVLIERRGDDTVTMTFHPVPSANDTLTYTPIRIARDVDTGAVTLDIPRPAQKGLFLAMAAYAASSLSADPARVALLRSEAEREKASARGWDKERVRTRFVPTW